MKKLICPCGRHSFKQYQMMKEAKASSEMEGAKTSKNICNLLDMANEPKPHICTAGKTCKEKNDNYDYNVSEWAEIGKERGYWSYYKLETAKELKELLEKHNKGEWIRILNQFK